MKSLIKPLSNKLNDTLINFFNENLEHEEETREILDLILSSHVSSLLNSMKFVSMCDSNIGKNVNEFLIKLLEFLSKNFDLEIKEEISH